MHFAFFFLISLQGLEGQKALDTHSGNTSLPELSGPAVSGAKGPGRRQAGTLHQFQALHLFGATDDVARIRGPVFSGLRR